jgi:hypothetical protein
MRRFFHKFYKKNISGRGLPKTFYICFSTKRSIDTYHHDVDGLEVGRRRGVGAASAGPPVVLRQASAQVSRADFLLRGADKERERERERRVHA